ncbi:MAG TPA: CehA/McbA family metallohydrolase [Solirubrobacteraceae bacterium]|nr:CehA/McbA family metallohydrolase [Solirubrobacteraceae bacterium]
MPAGARAHVIATAPTAVTAAVTDPCPGDPIRIDQLTTGSFESSLQGGYVLVPFDVPAGTTAVRVKYCFDQPEVPTPNVRHTLDLGLYEPLRGGDALPGAREFRGWGGSSHPDVTLSPEGFSTEAEYLARPKGHVPGKTTRGFRPGPIRPGRWSAELGLAAIAGRELGDADDRVAWRVEIEYSSDPAFADRPYRKTRYSTKPKVRKAGWYTGDLHVHAEHSALGDATMRETFDYAFGKGKLDFITLTDYVTDSAWGEIGRYKTGRHLVGRSSEVITYRGHTNNQLSGRYVDYRTGPVYDLRADGGVTLRRPAQGASRILRDVRRAGGFTQINHPTIFPSANPLFALLCRGCPWDYSAQETNYPLVDAIEVNTGPQKIGEAPNPFTSTAIDFYEAALARGAHAAALGVSDSHRAGRTDSPSQSPVGVGATAVFAKELSERGIRCAVKAGHTYAKIGGASGPTLRFTGRVKGVRKRAIFGDAASGRSLKLAAGATGGGVLQLLRDGSVIATGSRTLSRTVTGSGRYGLRVVDGQVTEAVGTPIWFRAAKRGKVTTRGC